MGHAQRPNIYRPPWARPSCYIDGDAARRWTRNRVAPIARGAVLHDRRIATLRSRVSKSAACVARADGWRDGTARRVHAWSGHDARMLRSQLRTRRAPVPLDAAISLRTPPASKWRPLFVLQPNPLQGVFATTPALGFGKKIGTANTCCALAVTVCGAARVMQAAGCAAGQRDARRDVAVMSLRRVRDALVVVRIDAHSCGANVTRQRRPTQPRAPWIAAVPNPAWPQRAVRVPYPFRTQRAPSLRPASAIGRTLHHSNAKCTPRAAFHIFVATEPSVRGRRDAGVTDV